MCDAARPTTNPDAAVGRAVKTAMSTFVVDEKDHLIKLDADNLFTTDERIRARGGPLGLGPTSVSAVGTHLKHPCSCCAFIPASVWNTPLRRPSPASTLLRSARFLHRRVAI